MNVATNTARMVRRYERRTYEPDDYTYDIMWIDRTTGRSVYSYDGGDPANYNPAYGGVSDADAFAEMGLDIMDECSIGQCVVPVSEHEVASWASDKARRAQRQAEEDAATDLLTLLGSDADSFDFGDYHNGEAKILRPAMERRGYTDVSFYMTEQDSFGPLGRGCVAYDSTGKRVRFYYG